MASDGSHGGFFDRLSIELLGRTNLARIDLRGAEGVVVGPHLDEL
jgi:hypothetical protein